MEVPEITLRIPVENIRNISTFHSPEFNVRGIPWQIQVFKRNDGVMSVYLKCIAKDNSTDWSCMASCKMKIISFIHQPFERTFKEPREFSANQRSYGYLKFITLKDLFDPIYRYIENDSIVMEVKVKASALIKLSEILANTELKLHETRKCFRLTIKNLSDFTGFYSPDVTVQRIPWRVKVYTTEILNTKAIAVSLDCAYACNSTNWSCKARAIFRLISFNENQLSHEWSFNSAYNFSRALQSHGTKRFITWKELVDKQYIQNDSFVLDVELLVQRVIGIGSAKAASTCPICLQNLQQGQPISSTLCGHVYCKLCIEKAVKKRKICPVCNQDLQLQQIHPLYLA